MSLVITIDTADELRDQFKMYNRDEFTLNAYQALVDYYHDCDLDVELDVAGICCEWTEADWKDVQSDYNNHEDLVECDNIEDFVNALNDYTIAYITDEDKVLYIYF